MSTTEAPRPARWTKAMEELRRKSDDIWARCFGSESDVDHNAVLTLPVDLAETDTYFEIAVDMPGISSADVQIDYHKKTLCISAQRVEETVEKGKRYIRRERRTGNFHRTIPLTSNIDSNKIDRSFEDGVLYVILPKASVAGPKRVKALTNDMDV